MRTPPPPRSKPLKTLGTRATPTWSARPTPSIPCGGTDQSSSPGDQIEELLTRKWERELDYTLRKDLWAFGDNRIAVRFQYEWHDRSGQWWRSYGNELWEFDADGYMSRREASINDVPIAASERRIFGPRVAAHPAALQPLR